MRPLSNFKWKSTLPEPRSFFFLFVAKKMHSGERKSCMNVAHAVPWPCPRLRRRVLLFHYLFNHWSTFVSLLHAKALPLEQFPLGYLVWMKFLLYWQWQYAMSRMSLIGRDWRRVVDRFCEEMRQETELVASWEKQGNVLNPEFNFTVSAPHSFPPDRRKKKVWASSQAKTGWHLAAEFVCFFPGCPNLAASDKPSPKRTKTHFWVFGYQRRSCRN